MAQKWPEMTPNGPKWPKYDPKWPKMALEWPNIIQNCPKMTQNGPKNTPNGPKMTPGFTHFFRNFFSEKAVPQTFSLLECMGSVSETRNLIFFDNNNDYDYYENYYPPHNIILNNAMIRQNLKLSLCRIVGDLIQSWIDNTEIYRWYREWHIDI